MTRGTWLALVVLGGCAPSHGGTEAEVAAELRALRQVLVAQQTQGQSRSAPASTADAAAALAPLREAFDGLAANQRELQQRQLELTQELQRWSLLLIENSSTSRREEGEALAARLRQLEASLQAQDARHREVEVLMQGALERTADRLGEFLRRVGADVEPEVTPTTPEPAKAVNGPVAPVPAPPAPVAEPPPPPGDGLESGTTDGAGRSARWEHRGAAAYWWWGVGLLSGLVGVLCVRRWVRAATSPTPARRAIEPPTGAAPVPTATADPDVQEIWAAAALLGEAVGRLRESPPAAPDLPLPEPGGELDDELIVLDDELLSPPAVAAEPMPADLPPAPRAAPATATCRLRTSDPARSMESVLQILQQDPRVLRRPEPAVRCSRDAVEVSYRLVPELPPGERSHLEQRLRDACVTGA